MFHPVKFTLVSSESPQPGLSYHIVPINNNVDANLQNVINNTFHGGTKDQLTINQRGKIGTIKGTEIVGR